MNIEPTNKGDWLMNFPRSIKGLRMRRAKLKEGEPYPTKMFTTEELKEKKIVGIYLDEDCPDGYYSRDYL